jgi:hypothetical protein
MPTCGISVAHSFTPDDTGPPMTDADLMHLERISHLVRVNLAKTRVTRGAAFAFQRSHPDVVVETSEDE